MHILTPATEHSLVALLTYHPTMTTLLVVVGVMVIISAVLMTVAVALRKKFAVPRSPENWDKAEVFVMSMFLHVWYLWACEEKDAPTKFVEDDELDVAFDKYVKELLHSGAIDKHWHGEDLMQELFFHAELNSKHPFGHDAQSSQSVRLNKERVQFAMHYAEKLRSLFIDMT